MLLAGDDQGRIVRILERSATQTVGIFHRRRGLAFLVPQEPPLTSEILIPSDRTGGAEDGQVVLVEIEDPQLRRQRLTEWLATVPEPPALES